MKLGKAEGTPEEITNFFENHGMNPQDYFEKIESPLHWKWIAIPAFISTIIVIFMVLPDSVAKKTQFILFLIASGCACWVATSVQLRFKNAWATTVVAVGILLVLMVAAGYLEPGDIINTIKGLKGE